MAQPTEEEVYAIPARYRQMENTHILFWLLKDISWCMVWKPLGILMIGPTLGIALVIAWRTRTLKSELAHNLAIVFWISANSYWMLSEFFGFDTVRIGTLTDGKHLAIIPFGIGLAILAYYYLVQKPREARAAQVATL
ncbi:hypothetical protein [Hymenobacter baengnokdamensis]|uniref:hypothetical protein n=1 Tax=Hymenobacter baengnokdamensis TaxID=2615203 RepID=UPI001E5D7FAC|nr:hypothetical protein [Hymenobacter baengnokdamensis]